MTTTKKEWQQAARSKCPRCGCQHDDRVVPGMAKVGNSMTMYCFKCANVLKVYRLIGKSAREVKR